MNRDELIETVAREVFSRLRPSGRVDEDWRDIVKITGCYLDVVEPLIRADEREQTLDIVGARGGIRDLTLYNLRAQVLSIRQDRWLLNSSAYNALTEVLDVIDGPA